MGNDLRVALGVLIGVVAMSMAVVIGFAASVGQTEVGIFSTVVAGILQAHWNLVMVAGPFCCCLLTYLGGFMVATGIQRSFGRVVAISAATDLPNIKDV